MTFYTRTWSNTPQLTIDKDSLEYKALKLKKLKTNIDSLNIAYERASESLTEIMLRQKDASEQYNDLKKDLVKAALELEAPEEDVENSASE